MKVGKGTHNQYKAKKEPIPSSKNENENKNT